MPEVELTHRFLSHIGFRRSPFDIEFYWEEDSGRIFLLEVDTRISKSHGPLFELVDGEYHHQVMLDVALGEKPDPPFREGSHPIAAKFMWRSFEDAAVRRVLSREEIERLRERLPGTEIEVHIEEGRRLSDLTYGDSYSYELAAIYLGGRDEAELLSRYDACRRGMTIELEPL